ncbi:MAG: hypothetical protein CMF74_05785 [Maricaulis sp.]|jgi:hypothetical protein|nr:hypothetical protein [Maricaulis sp.]HAQ35138.1 hypothetical protein [Alphaproteobacteria bacterium]
MTAFNFGRHTWIAPVIALLVAAVAMGFATLMITEPLAARWGPGQLKWTIVSFAIFAVAGTVIAAVTRRPLMAVLGALIVAPSFLGLDAWTAAAALMLCSLSAGAIVLRIFRRRLEAGTDALFAVIIGLATISTAIFLTSPVSIHTPLTYSLGIVALVAGGVLLGVFSDVIAIVRRLSATEVREINLIDTILAGLVIAAIVMLALYARLPVVDNDSLILHLRLPLMLQDYGHARFATEDLLVGHFPAAADWLYGFGAVIAGEDGAKAINLSFALLVGGIIITWLNLAAGMRAAFAGAALFLTAPILYHETVTLFVENYFTLLLLASVFFAWCYSRDPRPYYLLACTFTVGAAGAAKLLGLLIIPPLAIWLIVSIVRNKRYTDFAWAALAGGGLALLAAHWPYTMAWLRTGNPLFPFYNTFFRSPHGPEQDWINALFHQTLTPESFVRMSFDASPFLESAGVAFAPFIILAPIFLVLALLAGPAHRKLALTLGLPVLLVGLGYLILTSLQQTYLRYFFPLVPMWAVAMGVFSAPLFVRGTWRLSSVSVAALAVLITFQAVNGPGAFYFTRHLTPLQTAFSSTIEDMRRTRAPERFINDYLRGRTDNDEPVAYFWRPFIAGSTENAVALHPFYSWGPWSDFDAAQRAGGLQDFIATRGVRWFVLHDTAVVHAGAGTLETLETLAEQEIRLSGATLYRVRDDVFFDDVIAAFETPSTLPEGWTPVGEIPVEDGAVVVDPQNLLVLGVEVDGDSVILVEADIACGENANYAQLHMNWLDAESTFLRVDIPNFPCRTGTFPLRHEFHAPDGATQGVLVIDGPWGGTQEFHSFQARQNSAR